MPDEGANADAITEFHDSVLALGEAGLAALVLGLALIVFLLAIQTVRHF